MSLSKENYDKLNENFLYKKEPIIDNSFYVGNTSGTYHCKNWTFKVSKYKNGKAYMNDTYFGDGRELTDENIDEYEFIFDFEEVKRIHDNESNEYNEEDLYRVATDSGGYSCGHLYWVNKETKKNRDLLIDKKKEEIRCLQRDLKWAEQDLERLENREYWFKGGKPKW